MKTQRLNAREATRRIEEIISEEEEEEEESELPEHNNDGASDEEIQNNIIQAHGDNESEEEDTESEEENHSDLIDKNNVKWSRTSPPTNVGRRDRARQNRGLHHLLIQEIEKFVRVVSPLPSNQPLGTLNRESQIQNKARCSLCKASGKPTRACNLTSVACQICDQKVCGKHSQTVGVICNNCE